MKPPQGRPAIPRTIRGSRVEDLQVALSSALTEAVQRKVLDGELTLREVAARMRVSERIVSGYLAHPSRVNSLRHASALALAAGVRVRLEVDGGEAAGVVL